MLQKNFASTYFVVDAEVEFLVADSNRYRGVGMWIVARARLEHNVAVIFECSHRPQILSATQLCSV